MCMFTEGVSNGRKNALIVADLPNKSYENEADAIANSQRLINAGADAVKLEGRLPEIIKAIVQADICLLYTSPSPRDGLLSRMPSSA